MGILLVRVCMRLSYTQDLESTDVLCFQDNSCPEVQLVSIINLLGL